MPLFLIRIKNLSAHVNSLGGSIAHNDNPFCGGIILFGIGIILMYGGVQKYLLLQKISNTPTSKVRSAAVGLVELFGKAICKDELASPISKQKCVYWRLEAEYYQSGKHGGWRTIASLSSSSPFYLEDETGRMLIRPAGRPLEIDTGSGKERIEPVLATIEIPADKEFQGYISGKGMFGVEHTKLPQPVLDFIENSSPAIKKNFSYHQNEDVRIREYYIAEGDPLYVLGTAQPMEGASSSVGYENLFVGMGKNDKVFYISDSSERKITDSIKGSMPWLLLGGLAASAVGLILMLNVLKI